MDSNETKKKKSRFQKKKKKKHFNFIWHVKFCFGFIDEKMEDSW